VGSEKQSMISCEVLEKPGGWRGLLLAIIIIVSLGPALSLLWEAFIEDTATVENVFGGGFGVALMRSFIVAAAVILASIVFGVPTGVLSALYDFPGRRVLLAMLAIPLLVPTFLWAIGLSQLRIILGLPPDSVLSGLTGTIFSFMSQALPFVIYMTFASTRLLSKSQVDAVRLIGGERVLVGHAARAVLPASTVAALLAGILTLSDPGPGQILGYPGVAYEILLSFSAFYDFALAAKQCAILTTAVLLISVPVAVFIAPGVAGGFLGRQIQPAPLARMTLPTLTALCALGSTVSLTTVLPLIGILRPLFEQFPAARAFQEISRTLGNTFIYAITAGVIASVMGVALAVAVGREKRLRSIALVGVFLIVSLPPSLNALGMVRLGTTAPAWLDPLLRSKFTVGLALALRLFPIAAVLGMRSFGSTSATQCLVAAAHGVPLLLYIRRVLGPLFLPSVTLGCVIVALEGTADVGTALLLRPPGADSIPVQIFTVMANAPEALVAAMCFIYIGGAAILLFIGWSLLAGFEQYETRI
jgi:iron(III) transport system permease protein